MEDDTWSFGLSTSSRGYRSALKSLSDLCIDFEEIEGEDDLKADYPCPFCDEDFDLVELCCHIDDEHPLETKSGVCPVCATRLGVDMVGHIMTQHANIFKSLQRLKLHKGESQLTPSVLKELEDDYLQSVFASNSSMTSSSKMAPDPLLSFLYNVSPSDKLKDVQPGCSPKGTLEEQSSDENFERNLHPSPLTDEEHMEKVKRSEFVKGLLLSTIFDEIL